LCALNEAGPQLPSLEDLQFYQGMGLQDALSRFQTTLSVLQAPKAVTQVAAEMIEDAQAEGLSALEIRFAPQLHRGASMEKIVDAACEACDRSTDLILCGLYGEDPAVLNHLVEIARSRPEVVGIDLAGGPSGEHTFGLEDYAPAFHRAAQLGLGRTVHASEGRPADEIGRAINVLGANRIGHGTTLLSDPKMVDLVLEKNVTIEACPSSNVHVGAISSVEAHPIREWIKRGIRVTVCADNTLFSATNVPSELDRLGLSQKERDYVYQCSEDARFGRS